MDNISDEHNIMTVSHFLEEAELQQYYELFRDKLKVTKISQLKFVMTDDLVQIGMSKPEQRRYKKLYSKYFSNTYLAKIKKLWNSGRRNEMTAHGFDSMAIELPPFSVSNIKVPTKHIIPVEDITINKELGMGQFGVVQQGTWTTGNQRVQVAIKCLGHERMTSNSTEFLKEAAVMHSIEHPNIVRLYGVVLHLDSLMLVTELAPLRSLLECLREIPLRPNFPVSTLCDFAEQICDGMTYLENKRLIHRDLAARNILVFNKDKVKISDFGLSRALGVGKDYYQTNYNVNLKLPVAWCAPECILYLRFTSASDVWAFGVCLWEMFTYGFQPWAAFSGQQILETIDAPSCQRLERPECCTEAYYSTMLDCWSHEPQNRPKFKDLGFKLREIRPEQVQSTVNTEVDSGRRSSVLELKAGQVITVLGKETMTKTAMWYGVLSGGTCGMFDPSHTKPHCKSQPPKQVVTPYKPSEDLEQMPLINPNSPSHLTGGASSTPPYPLLSQDGDLPRTNVLNKDCDEVDLAQYHTKPNRRPNLRLISEPTTSKKILNKVKSATLGRSFRSDDGSKATTSKNDEIHEYQEISDTDTDSTAAEFKLEHHLPDSPGTSKSHTDFSQSLLDELETMFSTIESRDKQDNVVVAKENVELDHVNRSHTLGKIDKKKPLHTGTMKPMSAHERKTLDTAVALANEITTRSMNDLAKEPQKPPPSPNDRPKFTFKFPIGSSHQSQTAREVDKDAPAKQERRNFSDEAKSVPDIQSTLTVESKQAYASLIEQPTPSSSLITHFTKDPHMLLSNKKMHSSNHKHTLKPQQPHCIRSPHVDKQGLGSIETKDEFALPPKNTKPRFVDKPRHIRKYPLIIPRNKHENGRDIKQHIYQNIIKKEKSMLDKENSAHRNKQEGHQTPIEGSLEKKRILTAPDIKTGKKPIPVPELELGKEYISKLNQDSPKVQYQNINNTDGKDVVDGAANGNVIEDTTVKKPVKTAKKPDRNPFKETKPSTEANPFKHIPDDMHTDTAIVKDHVSVEDLLEFADQKPCGRQRGVESDEVRIMCKVLKNQVTPNDCLEVLELSDWNVHQAIKVIRVRNAVSNDANLQDCINELANSNGDIMKASATMLMKLQIKDN